MRPWSLAARLTTWYAMASITLVLAVVGLLYWALADNLDNEDDQELATKIQLLRTLLREHPEDVAALKEVVESESATEHPQHHEVYVRTISDTGAVELETPGVDSILPSSAFPTPIAAIAEPGPGVNTTSLNGSPVRIHCALAEVGTPSRGAQIIQVALDRTPEASLLTEYRQRVWLILGFAVVASSLGGYVVARRGIRPVEQITQTTKRVHSATLNQRIPLTNLPLEIEQLAGQFNEMLDRLEDSFARLSRFSNDIAHELRTPINNLRGSIEVTLSKDRAPDEYREALGSCLEESTRLGRIIESLLFLARSENPTTKITVETIDIASELIAIKDYYAGIIDEAGLTMIVDAPHRLICELDRTLFQRAVSNLLENSIAHTPQGGTLSVAAMEADGVLRVTVADTGEGISSNDLPHVLDRFYKAQFAAPSVASNSRGLGLGLAIVKGIAAVHGGAVEIDSQIGRGTRVTLVFPAHPAPR